MLAPKITEQNGLDGLISLAGSPRTLEDILYDQSMDEIEKQGLTGDKKDAYVSQLNLLIDQAKNAKQGDSNVILNAPGNYWYSLNSIDTVSYTHLDVYKRQEIFIVCPKIFFLPTAAHSSQDSAIGDEGVIG